MSALVKHYAPIYAIEIYRNDFREKIGTLIPSVQKEFGIEITLADQPELLNIPAVYQQGGGNFWVALNNGEVIGTIALIDIGNNIGVIRKMFLAPDHRGTGIGQQLLDTLFHFLSSFVRKSNSQDLRWISQVLI